jgi:hypothetical protein
MSNYRHYSDYLVLKASYKPVMTLEIINEVLQP